MQFDFAFRPPCVPINKTRHVWDTSMLAVCWIRRFGPGNHEGLNSVMWISTANRIAGRPISDPGALYSAIGAGAAVWRSTWGRNKRFRNFKVRLRTETPRETT